MVVFDTAESYSVDDSSIRSCSGFLKCVGLRLAGRFFGWLLVNENFDELCHANDEPYGIDWIRRVAGVFLAGTDAGAIVQGSEQFAGDSGAA